MGSQRVGHDWATSLSLSPTPVFLLGEFHGYRSLAGYRPREWQSTPVLLPGKSHGQRSLIGYSPWGRKESDMAERLHFHFHKTILWDSLVAQMVKCLPAMRNTQIRSLCREDPLEKKMATHSSTLAWKILWTEEPGGLPSMGSQRVGHDWATSLSLLPVK